MTARILDGNALSARIRAEIAVAAAQLKAARNITPCLAVLLVGNDSASAVYVKNKVLACEKAGFHSIKQAYPEDVAPAIVLDKIAELNADARVHGILVQLPLPPQFDSAAVLAAIAPHKDVDGFHAENVGALVQGTPRFVPCTPCGVMKMLEAEKTPLAGQEAVIVGRSNIVGKPMALLLLAQNATVTVCHSRTRDLTAHTRRADILIAAVGRAKMISGEMVKPGATVVDVGINRLADGKLCGDVEFASVSQVAGLITPVPGGVGPMTITMLLTNTLQAAQRA